MSDREVWITGIGLLTSLGVGHEETWKNLVAGSRGFTTPDLPEAELVDCKAVAKVPGFRARNYISNRKSLKLMTRPVRLGIAAANLAFEDAGLDKDALDAGRTGVFVGAGQAFAERKELEYALEKSRGQDGLDMVAFGREGLGQIHPLWLLRGLSNNVLGFVSLEYTARGINNNYCNSGVAGMQAIHNAALNVAEGRLDVAFAGGYDDVACAEALLGYGRLGLVSTTGEHRSFSDGRDGMVPGEGAAFLILESREHAEARGATRYARWLGGGVASDAFGITDPDPSGGKMRRAMEAACQEAQCAPSELGAVFAHGAASVSFDAIEARVFAELSGDKEPLVTADKSALGHTVAAGGAISTALAALAYRHQVIPPMASTPSPQQGVRFVTETTDHPGGLTAVCSAGLGGQAASLILGE